VNVDRSFSVSLNRRLYGLDDFVHALLTSQIRFCSVVRARRRQQLRFAFVEIPCEHCGRNTHVYHVDTRLVARCGMVFTAAESWYSDTFAFHPQVIAAASRISASEVGTWLHRGDIRPRTSERENETYTSFGCVHCDAMLDRSYVEMTLYGTRRVKESYETDAHTVDVAFPESLVARVPHWCYPPKGVFCCSTSQNLS
jgi:hypothetical protein